VRARCVAPAEELGARDLHDAIWYVRAVSGPTEKGPDMKISTQAVTRCGATARTIGRVWRYSLAGSLALSIALVTAIPAVAAGPSRQTVKCVGTADFCGATVSIAGGASNRQVTVALTDTDLKLVSVQLIPSTSKGAYSISKASYSVGGSVYKFTLSAVRANPKGARIVLLFAAGSSASARAGV
jgi:hypothetical protein